ncbi:hypothetical protein D3C79_547440 [compost metagenome]
MAEDVDLPLRAEHGAQVHQCPGTAQRQGLLHYQQQAEADRQHRQQVQVGADQHLGDHRLQKKRAEHHAQLQRRRQQQHMAQYPAKALHPAQQLTQPQRRVGRPRLEIALWPQLQGHAGEGCRDFIERQLANAAPRIVQGHPARADLLEHHEVVEVPVQHTGQAQLPQRLQFQTQRPAGQAQLAGHGHQLLEGCALHRRRQFLAQRKQVVVLAMVTGDHRQAGLAALGGFGLEHHGQLAADAESQRLANVQRRFPMPRRGSSSHS